MVCQEAKIGTDCISRCNTHVAYDRKLLTVTQRKGMLHWSQVVKVSSSVLMLGHTIAGTSSGPPISFTGDIGPGATGVGVTVGGATGARGAPPFNWLYLSRLQPSHCLTESTLPTDRHGSDGPENSWLNDACMLCM